MLDNYKILVGKDIEYAMKLIGKNGSKCLIVVNKSNKILGTLSDGDIRAVLLKKLRITEKIDKHYNNKPTIIKEKNYSISEAKKIFIKKNLWLIPIANKKKELIDVIDWKTLYGDKKTRIKKNFSTPVVIMAGGKGTRLEPFTHILPKPLLPLEGKAVIEHIIEKFRKYDLQKFIISTNFKAAAIKGYFSELRHDYKINYISEKKPLGTAGCLKSLQNKIKGDFFVVNCDCIISADLSYFYSFHQNSSNDISIIASYNDYIIPYGICKTDKFGNLSKIDEKPKVNFLANAGCYLVNSKVLKLIPKNKFFDFTDLIKKAKDNKFKIGVYPISSGEWIDVGEWNQFNKLSIK